MHTATLIEDGELIDGQYRLLNLLGEGGMGSVWAADDLRLERRVAIKFLSKDLLHDEHARIRFEREARVCARIRSPHVVQIFAQGMTDREIPFLVMELLTGEDLSRRIERDRRLRLVEIVPIVEQICLGLMSAHKRGLIHRDIKPQNIFLADHEPGRHSVKLLDFGIAKDLDSPLTALTVTGEVLGSALYISPEQLRDPQSVGPATDVWALGVVIYEMLTGRPPFDAKSLPELFDQLRDGRFVPATKLVPSLPMAIDAYLCRAIHNDCTQRFDSVEALHRAFVKVVAAHTSVAEPGAVPQDAALGSLPVCQARTLSCRSTAETMPATLSLKRPLRSMLTPRSAGIALAAVTSAIVGVWLNLEGPEPEQPPIVLPLVVEARTRRVPDAPEIAPKPALVADAPARQIPGPPLPTSIASGPSQPDTSLPAGARTRSARRPHATDAVPVPPVESVAPVESKTTGEVEDYGF
jgi:serine/threonine-protein kinase